MSADTVPRVIVQINTDQKFACLIVAPPNQ